MFQGWFSSASRNEGACSNPTAPRAPCSPHASNPLTSKLRCSGGGSRGGPRDRRAEGGPRGPRRVEGGTGAKKGQGGMGPRRPSRPNSLSTLPSSANPFLLRPPAGPAAGLPRTPARPYPHVPATPAPSAPARNALCTCTARATADCAMIIRKGKGLTCVGERAPASYKVAPQVGHAAWRRRRLLRCGEVGRRLAVEPP